MSTFFSCIYRSLCYNENKACLKKILYVGSCWIYDPDFCGWKFFAGSRVCLENAFCKMCVTICG